MKFQPGQQAILLNTEFKPAADAVVKSYDAATDLYDVVYKYPKSIETEEIRVPQERLMAVTTFLQMIQKEEQH
jgi:hypothetical protein